MRAVTPAGLGVRNLRGLWRHSALLAVVVAVVVAGTFAVFSVRSSAQYSGEELARIAMGEADLQARFAGGDVASVPEVEPGPGTGIARVLTDTDLRTTLVAGTASQMLDGRVVAYEDPMTTGIVTFARDVAGSPELALSPAAADRLGVVLGDTVGVRTAGSTVALTFTDEVRYAGATDAAFFLISPPGADAAQLEQIVDGASSSLTPRWLVESTDPLVTGQRLRDLGLTVATRGGFTAQPPTDLVDVDLVLGGVGLVAAGVLGATTASLAQARGRQDAILRALGATRRERRTVWSVHAGAAAGGGAAVGLVLGAVVTHVGVALLSGVVHQDWGGIDYAWLPGILAAALASAAVLVVVVGGVREPAAAGEPARGRGPAWTRRGGYTVRVAARLATRSRGLRRVGVVVVGSAVAVSCAGLATVEAARERAVTAYVAAVPVGDAELRTGRALTDAERSAIEVSGNLRVIDDARASFTVDSAGTDVPVVLESDFTRCARAGAVDDCLDRATLQDDRSVLLVDGADEAAALLGRDVTAEERSALDEGDGLLLVEPDDDVVLVPPPGYSESETDFRRALDPVAVDGYATFGRLPALIVSAERGVELGLFEERSGLGFSFLVPQTGAIDESVVRTALPADVSGTAELVVEAGPPLVGVLDTIARTTLLVGSGLVVLVVLLLVAAWAEDSAPQLRALAAVGARPRMLRGVLVLRSLVSVLPAVLLGLGTAAVLAGAFALVAGARLSGAGDAWWLPVLVAVLGSGAAAWLLAPVPRQSLARR